MSLHPLVAQVGPSPEQEPAVTARGSDVVVTAGAGTGKTRTLVARYLALAAELPDDVPLRAIAAVTFTRKAAREMRNRVREEMRRYLERPLDDDERARWQSRYSELDAARVGTIHKLCAEILRAHPAEGAVDPRFEVLEEDQSRLLIAEALDAALAWAANDASTAPLFGLLGERPLRATLDWLVARRLDAASAFALCPDDPLALWADILERHQRPMLDEMLTSAEWRRAVEALRSRTASDPDDALECQRRRALAIIDGAPSEPVATRIASLADLADISVNRGSAGAWPAGAEDKALVKEALRLLREPWKSGSGVLSIAIGPLDGLVAAHMPALRALFERALGAHDARKLESQALDYDDLEQRSIDLLRRDSAVRARWQRELAAILVDEFQDTNARQRDLLALVNGDGGRLFVVGDAKQSIYRFRGADVAVFRRTRSDVQRRGGTVIDLALSYRAHAPLVRALNALLCPILGQQADESRPWVEPFAPLAPARIEPAQGLGPPYVELILAAGSKKGGALERAATELAARLAELVEPGTVWLGPPEARRRLEYGDIAIMCRSSTSFGAYEDALEAAGVPVLTVAGRGFYGRPEIRDLLNALTAIADPVDDLALVGLLRSPAFHLSDASIYEICEAWRRLDDRPSLWQALAEHRLLLPAEERLLVGHAVSVVAMLHDRLGRQAVGDVLKAFLDLTDYRAALVRAGQRRAARNVGKLLDDAYDSGIVRLGEFLTYVSSLRDVGAREGEARATAEGAVQLMSVHAAKGLEFAVVVIGDASYAHRGGSGVLLDEEVGVALPLKDEDGAQTAAYRLAKLRADDQESAESDRLLYVAATRARELLIVNGCIGLKSDGTPTGLTGWLGCLALPLGLAGIELADLDAEGDQVCHVDLLCDGEPVSCIVCGAAHLPGAGASAKLAAVDAGDPPDVAMLAPVAPTAISIDETADREMDPPHHVWRIVPIARRAHAPARIVGLIVHEALAAWRFPDDGFEAWAASRARHHGVVDAGAQRETVSRCRELLRRFRDTSLCAEIESADRRLAEVPYSRIGPQGSLEVGTIDLLFACADGWTLVDYKTDRYRQAADLAEPPALGRIREYRAQVGRYVDAVEALLGTRPRALLCLLDVAGTVNVETVG